jgi:hypothetical protein
MAKNYLQIRPVQQFDPTACWAASLEWWARAIGGRPVIRQIELLNLYLRYWDSSNPDTNPNYGTISRDGLIAVLNDTRWGMSAEAMPGVRLTTTLINQKMRRGPVIVGYYEPAVQGNHVVVAYGASNTHIAAMNPDGGRFIGLPAAHYSHSAEVILGVPTR